jgi:hypothetical protein
LVGVGFADGSVGIFWWRGRFLDGRRHGLGGSAETKGRECRRDEIRVGMHGIQMQELGQGFGAFKSSERVGSVESPPFGFAQGRLFRQVREGMRFAHSLST